MTKPGFISGKNGQKGKEKLRLSFPQQPSVQMKGVVPSIFKSYYERHLPSVNFQASSSFALRSHGAEPALLGCELHMGLTPTLVLSICHYV